MATHCTVVPDCCETKCACASGCISGDALQRCTVYPKVHCCLVEYFKLREFRTGQLEAVLAVLHGRDVFVRLPTGGGKSLCMFLVPLVIGRNTLGVIISPLNGLMDEQVKNILYDVCTPMGL